MPTKDLKKYWKTNLKYLSILLTIWFIVSYLFGIILVDELNTIRLGGFKLGFWFAQQGSILVFLGLVFFYSWKMNRLDKKYGVEENDAEPSSNSAQSSPKLKTSYRFDQHRNMIGLTGSSQNTITYIV